MPIVRWLVPASPDRESGDVLSCQSPMARRILAPPHPSWIEGLRRNADWWAGMFAVWPDATFRSTILREPLSPDRSPGHAFVPFARAGWWAHLRYRSRGADFRANRWCRSCLPQPLWIPAFAGMTIGGGILFALTSILSHRWRGGGPHLPGRTTLPPLAGDKRRRYRALWCWGLAPAVRVCLSSGGCGKRLED